MERVEHAYRPDICSCGPTVRQCPSCAAWASGRRTRRSSTTQETVARCTRCRHPWDGPLYTCDRCLRLRNASRAARARAKKGAQHG